MTTLLSCTVYLPGESPFASNKIPSPDTPVKLVFIRKSRSVAPSIGRMASHRPLKYMNSQVICDTKVLTCSLNNRNVIVFGYTQVILERVVKSH